MKVREYSYLCSQKLLSQIASNTYADALGRDVASLEYLSKEYLPEKDVDIKWQLISTALLMSEGLFKNAKTYDYITQEVLGELENVLGSIGLISNCRPLNIHNEPVYDFYSLVHEDTPDEDTYRYYDHLGNLIEESHDYEEVKPSIEDKDYTKEEEWFEDFEQERERERGEAIIANESFIVDGKINLIGFIKMVRNALAHSSYEILDDTGCIRLFHYNHDKKKLDMNIVLDENVIIPIIDIINEVVYKNYRDFDDFSSYEDFSYSDYYGPRDTPDERLIDFILSFGICDEEVAKKILKEAKKTELYNIPSFDSDLEVPLETEYDNENKLKAICATMREYIRPLCDYGIIINDLAYTKDGFIVSDELYDKYEIYNYLKGEFYGSTYALANDPEYIENELRLKILSLLNCLLLTINNEVHNNNLDDLILDFSAMYLPKETEMIFEARQIKKNTALAENIKLAIVNNVKDGVKLQGRIDHKTKQLKECYRDIEYYNKTLPEELKKLDADLAQLKIDRKILGKYYLSVFRNLQDYNYDNNLAVYILNSLRNSLAHGNVRFDDSYEDIGDMQITFEDYNPDNPSELTFVGTISLCDLIEILISKENVDILKR